MTDHPTASIPPFFACSIRIDASVEIVWQALVDPHQMQQWMSEEPVTVVTDWRLGNAFTIKGDLHWVPFENTGKVLAFEPYKHLAYTHLSSLSRLADTPENYSITDFKLISEAHQTQLELALSTFPTTAIYHHLAFYWPVTLRVLKNFIEQR